ncbi:MAG: response regulator transcription factor [Oscillospiraceae bacterium]|nr:response regulator transcription factor [Oscillospiraceae bacterium]
MNTILLIEDNAKILESNREYLEAEGYAVYAAATLKDGSAILRNQEIDLIVLDIMLPDGSGIDFCADIRKQYDIPVLYLTCLEEDTSLVGALKAGGDEYMTKPYKLDALSARVMALLRRVRIERSAPEVFKVGPLTVDCGKRIMLLYDTDMLLKPKEFDLLLTLVRDMERLFSAEELYTLVWSGIAVDKRTVAVHISSLRKKLENSPFIIATEQRKYYSLFMG